MQILSYLIDVAILHDPSPGFFSQLLGLVVLQRMRNYIKYIKIWFNKHKRALDCTLELVNHVDYNLLICSLG